jgi:hypothetical protein
MSARRILGSGSLQDEVTVQARQTRLTLSPETVTISSSGIEFRSTSPFSRWTEMTLTLQSPRGEAKVNCTGVVVACSGNKHAGYQVSMLFTGLSRQAQTRLGQMAAAQLG